MYNIHESAENPESTFLPKVLKVYFLLKGLKLLKLPELLKLLKLLKLLEVLKLLKVLKVLTVLTVLKALKVLTSKIHQYTKSKCKKVCNLCTAYDQCLSILSDNHSNHIYCC